MVTDLLEIEPGKILFADDKEANVEGARRAGFVGHHFTGAESLAETLRL